MAREMLLMGLRLTEGVSAERFHARVGSPLESALDRASADPCPGGRLCDVDDGRLAATGEGLRRLDALLGYLVC